MTVQRRAVVSVLVVIATLVAACSREEPPTEIELAETPVLSGRESYALITIEYARLYRSPETGSETLVHARRGDVLAVLSSTPDQLWYRLQAPGVRGWVDSEAVRLFPTEEQARNARGMLDVR